MLLLNWLREFTDELIWSLSVLTINLLFIISLIAGIIWIVKNPDKLIRFLQWFFR